MRSKQHSFHNRISQHLLYLDDLPQTNGKGEGFLSCILGGPKFFGKVTILAKSSTVNGNVLATGRLDSISSPNQCLGESHLDVSVLVLINSMLMPNDLSSGDEEGDNRGNNRGG